jgi:hypothetical protein
MVWTEPIYKRNVNTVFLVIDPCGGGLEYLHRSAANRKETMKRELSARVYNWATLFLGDINTGAGPPASGRFKYETVKCDREFCGTRARE